MENQKLTVGQLVASLLEHDQNAPVEIVINQYNKRYPVAYLPIDPHHRTLMSDTYAICPNGIDVRIEVSLPYDNDKFTILSTVKNR